MISLSENKKHEICKQALEAKKNIETKFLELGALLYTVPCLPARTIFR